jgi:hypothetical protein
VSSDPHKKLELKHDNIHGELSNGARMSVRLRHYLDQSLVAQTERSAVHDTAMAELEAMGITVRKTP